MADATPITEQDPSGPAPATEIQMPPVETKEVVQTVAKVDAKEIQKTLKALEAEGKKGTVIGNAVRVDN